MNIEKLREIQRIQEEINDIEYETNHINDLISNANGTCKVKINTKWIVNIPASALKGFAIARKADLDSRKLLLENSIDANLPDKKIK